MKKEQKLNMLEEFKEYAKALPEGELYGEHYNKTFDYICNCWDLFDIIGDDSRTESKLNRMENLSFQPPSTITFMIERHGPTVNGSIYAALHHWVIDLEKGSAECDPHHKRLVGVRAKPLKIEPLAEKIAEQIINTNKTSEYLEWKSDNRVKIIIGKVIPGTNIQTTTKRRRRFRETVEALLLKNGWFQTSVNTYEKN